MDLSVKYQKKSDKQQVLDNPDTCIGSVEEVECVQYVVEDGKMVARTGMLIPGLLKLFDECIVNCRDHAVRMASTNPVTCIEVSICDGVIEMTNDGDGIDVVPHPEYAVYIPELIFAHMRTSTNYDKSEKKVVGGKNGLGVKLAFIWSSSACIETVDAVRQLKYTQTFQNNLDDIGVPVIKPYKKKAYTKISFRPDYNRFKIEGLSEFHQAVFSRRVYDLAAVTDKRIKVKLNGALIPVKSFMNYVDLYLGDTDRASESCDRWEVVVAMSDDHRQVSFVNGIHTSKGGKHVDYIMGQIIRKVAAFIKLKKKVDVKPAAIREHLSLFLQCTIENPSFDSQTKETLMTPVAAFGSECEISDKFAEKIARLGIMDLALAQTQAKEDAQAKKHDGAKTRTIRGIPKLVDANFAGTAKSASCTLILCEGDSAKAGVVSGLSRDDRNTFGVYPLKGKMLNVRGEALKKITDNKEIRELMQILGLECGRVYGADDVRKLRYGHVLFMTDQDLDGSHIKGLGINVFDAMWRSLLEQPSFLGFMSTPILKARRGTKERVFYTEAHYREWRDSIADADKWSTKYYKGLGTSTAAEFKEYFKTKKIVQFDWTPDSAEALDKVFNKARAEDRKAWLGAYNRDKVLCDAPSVSFEQFVDDDLIHFSTYDNQRSIPSVIDGMKPSQRKVLFGAFKKNLKQEIKVAQFSGYVSEHAAYHHGEASLNGTIVGMAQDFVGSNNINLLEPRGQFGTRLQGGKDSASERYIFTRLSSESRRLFPEEDDAVLETLYDDGSPVEPRFYAPVIPMVLVNGCKGIGTGFSTDVPAFHPFEIKSWLVARLQSLPYHEPFVPYYRGFKGAIEIFGDKFIIRGRFQVQDLVVRITELPVGVWTDDYKEFLESLVGTTIKEYTDHSTDTTVDLSVKLLAPVENVEKTFKLSTTKSLSNMYLFTSEGYLRKYPTVESILDDFFLVRLQMYVARKAHLIAVLNAVYTKLSAKVAYIKGVLDGSLDLRGKCRSDIDTMLNAAKLPRLGSYDYLTKMPMDSVSEENARALQEETTAANIRLCDLESKSPEAMWLEELEKLDKSI